MVLLPPCFVREEVNMNENNYVLMAVPAELVPQIAALIAAVPQASEPVESGGWDGDAATRLYTESSEPQRRILAVLAEANGEEVTTDDLAARSGVEPRSLPGTLGALGRRCPSRYGLPTPWHRRWDAEGHAVMKLPVEVAEVIQSLAKQ
jgi:hypothetical protein